MLHVETVESGTFSLLRKLMQIPELSNFALVGGTALSLLYGHRKSIDLDLFSTVPFNPESVVESLKNNFPDSFENRTSNPRIGVFCFIEDIKTDFIHHSYPLLQPMLLEEGVRLFSTEDILAMKVQAIFGRAKKKDFWDIAELLHHYSISDLIRCHEEKYRQQNLLISIPQAITYFKDADESEDPVSLKGENWEQIKKLISEKVRIFLQ